MATLPVPAMIEQQQEPQAAPQTQDYGQNNVNLPEDLQKALYSLIVELERADALPRRIEVYKILQRRLYFRGEQYWWGSEEKGLWYPSYVPPPGVSEEEENQPTFQHVTNIYQAFELTVASVLGQNNVPSRFKPQSAKDPIDVSTAKNASKVVELVQANNRMSEKSDDLVHYAWNDGFIGACVRFVTDGEQFGYDEVPKFEPVEAEIAPAMMRCEACGYEEPMPEMPDEAFGTCPSCGNQMAPIPPIFGMVPKQAGIERVEKGQEVIEFVPALNLRRSMWANEQKDFLYLTWVDDAHQAAMKAAYKHLRDKFEGVAQGESTGVDTHEWLARRILFVGYGKHSGPEQLGLGTRRRTWLRPRAFENIADEKRRTELQTLFPKGCYVIFFNDVYCESKNEGMDEKWVTMHSLPGEGQVRETLGSALLPIQDQLNDAVNLIFETAMYGVPEGFGSKDAIDFEARSKQTAAPGNMTPIELRSNQRIGDLVTFTQATEPSQAIVDYRNQLFSDIPQFISGAFAALFGGDTGTNDTARGITIQRDQALGRVGRVWRKIQEFRSQMDLLAVQCFAKNRKKDEETSVLGEGGDWKSEFLSLEELKGSITATPEIDRQYPILQSQIRALEMELISSSSPLLPVLMAEPKNVETFSSDIGLGHLEIPGADQRAKTSRDIDQLLSSAPIPAGMDQMTGQPILLPSLMPDELVDELPIALQTCKKWLRSEAGQKAAMETPQGFQNVYLYAKAADNLIKKAQLMQAIAAQGASGGGPAADLGGAQDIQTETPESEGAKPGETE